MHLESVEAVRLASEGAGECLTDVAHSATFTSKESAASKLANLHEAAAQRTQVASSLAIPVWLVRARAVQQAGPASAATAAAVPDSPAA